MAALALVFALAATARAGEQQTDEATKIPPGAKYSQAFIPSTDGVQLHADILRPAQLSKNAKTPVILSIGPYFNHSGQTGPLGPVEATPFNPATSMGPSTRFYDFETGGDLFKKGYTYVMVDLRDFGGSNGCLDWAGPGEQADVKAAVEWAHRQKWSTGKVGMYGKSYDGVTGLIAEDLQPKGLTAIVAGEPVYDLYRYLYMNRVRFVNSLATPALYDGIAGTPGTGSDTIAYNTNALNDTSRPGCPVFNHADQQDPNHDSPYWKIRNLIPRAKRGRTPLFMTQGFIENNTKPDGAFDYFNSVKAPKRGWFGQWEHVRGNDRDEKGRLRMGRHGWFKEVMHFYDHYLKGVPASRTIKKDPKLAVESSDGKWRAETRWPPSDAFKLTGTLNPGTYVDDGQNNGTNVDTPPNGDGIWTFSPKFTHLVHYAGVPHVKVETEAAADMGNLVVDTYDVDKGNMATLISRGAFLLNAGTTKASYDLYGNDWLLPAGHRLGVLITSSNAEWWAHVGTGQPITVKRASISLGFAAYKRPKTIEGGESIFLEDYLKHAPFQVDPGTVKANTRRSFPVPGPLVPKPKTRCAAKRRLRFKIHGKTVVRVDVFVNGKHVKRVRSRHGRYVKHVSIRRPRKKRFRVKIVAHFADGRRTITVRKYRRCSHGGVRRKHKKPRHRHRRY